MPRKSHDELRHMFKSASKLVFRVILPRSMVHSVKTRCARLPETQRDTRYHNLACFVGPTKCQNVDYVRIWREDSRYPLYIPPIETHAEDRRLDKKLV